MHILYLHIIKNHYCLSVQINIELFQNNYAYLFFKTATMTALPPKSIVLYADDDHDDIALVREAFRNYPDVELLTFENGVELLNFVHHEPGHVKPCLIILDINMPRLNGKEVLKQLRNTEGYEDIPVVLFSTSTLPSEGDFARSFNAGFITKPLHFEQISFIAENLIEHCTDEVKKRIKRFNKE